MSFHYDYLGTRLQGADPSNARADLRIGGRNLRFLTGPTGDSDGTEAVKEIGCH